MTEPIYLASIPTSRFVYRISIVERSKDFAVFVHWLDNLSKTKAWMPTNRPRSCATLRGAKSSATQMARKLMKRGYVVVSHKSATIK